MLAEQMCVYMIQMECLLAHRTLREKVKEMLDRLQQISSCFPFQTHFYIKAKYNRPTSG